MKIRTTLKELRDADVRLISLVDRASTRIPIRILKRDDEGTGVDLANLFVKETVVKSESPEVVALVVHNQTSPELAAKVVQSIAAAGFAVDKVTKADEGATLIFAQGEIPEDTKIIRLSDQMVVLVKGITTEEEDQKPYLAGVTECFEGLYKEVTHTLKTASDSGGVGEQIKTLLASFDSYILDLVGALPTAVFKADYAVQEVLLNVPDATTGVEEAMSTEVKKADLSGIDLFHIPTAAPEGITQNDWDKLDDLAQINWILGSWANKSVPAAGPTQKGDGTLPVAADDANKKCSKCKGNFKGDKEVADDSVSDVQKAEAEKDKDWVCPKCKAKAEEEKNKTTKSETETILEAIKGVEAKVEARVAELAVKVDGVVAKQEAQATELKSVVEKSDGLTKALRNTVAALPKPVDNINLKTEVVKKADADPRTGCFDTAFIPRKR